MTDSVLYSREGHIGRLTINVPERHNSLGREQLVAMQEHLEAVGADRQVRVPVLTGAGDKTSCAGASLSELRASTVTRRRRCRPRRRPRTRPRRATRG